MANREQPKDPAEFSPNTQDFVWRTLYRMGVEERDLPDKCQDVLVIVHRKYASYDPQREFRGWVYGICTKVSAAYHRSAMRRHERLAGQPLGFWGSGVDDPKSPSDPERDAIRGQARRQLGVLLDQIEPGKRAVFVMFEVAGMETTEISKDLGIPVGTVHSRLHEARKQFAKALERHQRRIHATGDGDD